MVTSVKTVEDSGRQGRTIRLALGLIFVLFIGILVTVAIVSKRANPIMLDENGRPVKTHNE